MHGRMKTAQAVFFVFKDGGRWVLGAGLSDWHCMLARAQVLHAGLQQPPSRASHHARCTQKKKKTHCCSGLPCTLTTAASCTRKMLMFASGCAFGFDSDPAPRLRHVRHPDHRREKHA